MGELMIRCPKTGKPVTRSTTRSSPTKTRRDNLIASDERESHAALPRTAHNRGCTGAGGELWQPICILTGRESCDLPLSGGPWSMAPQAGSSARRHAFAAQSSDDPRRHAELRTKSTSARWSKHPTENAGGDFALLIGHWLATSIAVNLDALNLT